jgi:SMP-30/Gluconolactonase/LRE-like region
LIAGEPLNRLDYPLPHEFTVLPAQLAIAAVGLKRPECVLATSDGVLHTSDWRGGIAATQSGVLTPGASRLFAGTIAHGRATRANGIAISKTRGYLFADLGESEGGVFSLSQAGQITPLVTALEGKPLPPSNFVIEDAQGRIWFTVSTRQIPRDKAWRSDVRDGFIAVLDEHGARIVADGLGYTNEIAFSPDAQWVYVNETYTRQISRFKLLDGAKLGPKEVVAQLGAGNFPDGLTFDAFGGLWITCIVGNRVLVLRPDTDAIQTVLDAADPSYVAQFEAKYLSATLTPKDTASCGASPLGNISSLAFGGPDLKTAYLGCLLDDKIRAFASPVAGYPPLHWEH